MRDLLISLRQRPVAFSVNAIAAFSVLWTVTDALEHFFGWPALKSVAWFAVVIGGSIIFSLYRIWSPSRVVIVLPMSNVSIELAFGNIFGEDGVAAIPVNEFFDSEIGLPVSGISLHGIFLQQCFGGHGDAFDRQIADQLPSTLTENVHRKQGKLNRFPIGTTAQIESAGRRYLAFAFTRTDLATCKAYADVPQMFSALAGLWTRARTELGGNALNLPLVGSGLSGIGLPARDLVNIIVLSFIDETKRQIVAHKIRVVLTPDRRSEVDLREIKRYWEAH
jgi:hypothetical protein